MAANNMLEGLKLASHPLFQKMHDGINHSASEKSGEGAWAYVSTAIAEALGESPNSIYCKLYPEIDNNKKHQLFRHALQEVDNNNVKELTNKELAVDIMSAFYTLCKEQGVDLKAPKEAGEESKPRASRTFTWQFKASKREAFSKQEELNNLQNLKNAMEKCNMTFPAEQATQLDKLEKEAEAWNKEHNSSAELEEARSANYQEYKEQVRKFLEALTSNCKKAGMLARAGEAGLDICKGLQNGTEAEKEEYKTLETLVSGLQKINSVLNNFKFE